MYLYKATDCLEKLNNLFERTSEDFTFANALCDVLLEVEKQAEKYAKMKANILKEHYVLENDSNYKIKRLEELETANKKFQELNTLDFTFKKVTVRKPDMVSPKELYYLREFFIFE